MDLLKNTRQKIGKIILRNKTARTNRKVFYSDFNHVKNIGIVWDASKYEDFTELSKFYQKMHDKNINVNIICYFPGKVLPDRYTAVRYLTCLRKNELSLFYNPLSAEAADFISNPFDVLIDVNFNCVLPLQFITSLSDARFKVGLFEKGSDDTHFDLMLEINKPVNLADYLNQVIHYLEMMNSGTTKIA